MGGVISADRDIAAPSPLQSVWELSGSIADVPNALGEGKPEGARAHATIARQRGCARGCRRMK